MKFHNLIYLLVFIMIIGMVGLVSAVPPFQVGDFPKGLEIEIPNTAGIRQNQLYHFHIHVFNSTGGVFMESPDTSCYLHIYDIDGGHITEQQMAFDSNNLDFKLNVNATNFTRAGQYPLIAFCNTSVAKGSLGGFAKWTVEVTPNGQVLTNATSIAYVGFFGLFAFFILLCMYWFSINEAEWIKALTFGGIWLLTLFLNYALYLVGVSYLYSASFIGVFFQWMFIIQLILTFPMFLGMVLYYLYAMITNKYMMSMLKHGVAEDRAIMREQRRGMRKK